MNFSKWPVVRLFAAAKEKQQLQLKMSKQQAEFSAERTVLVDEITRLKHMAGVHQKLFTNLGMYKNTFTMVQSSLSHLLDRATCNTKYAVVAEIETVKIAHLMFKMEIYGRFLRSTNPMCAVNQSCQPDPLPSFTATEFGQWYYGEGQKLADQQIFRSIDETYRRLHVCAEAALDMFHDGEYLEGVDKVTDMEHASSEIITSLESLAISLMEKANDESQSKSPAASVPEPGLQSEVMLQPTSIESEIISYQNNKACPSCPWCKGEPRPTN